MATLQEILARAQALREETELGSISPERAGSIMYDTLQQINQMQLLGASLVINKIYASVAAMEADSAPVSDLSGTALKEGQLVVIVPSDTSSSDMGSVYRFDGIEDSASTWSFTGKIGGYPMDETPTEGSTRAVTSGGVYSEVSRLAQNVTPSKASFVGNNNTFAWNTTSVLAKPGRVYRLIPFVKEWAHSSVSSTANFIALGYTLGGVNTTLATCAGWAFRDYYDVAIPFTVADGAYLLLGGRANVGVNVEFAVYDVTDVVRLAPQVEGINLTGAVAFTGNQEKLAFYQIFIPKGTPFSLKVSSTSISWTRLGVVANNTWGSGTILKDNVVNGTVYNIASAPVDITSIYVYVIAGFSGSGNIDIEITYEGLNQREDSLEADVDKINNLIFGKLISYIGSDNTYVRNNDTGLTAKNGHTYRFTPVVRDWAHSSVTSTTTAFAIGYNDGAEHLMYTLPCATWEFQDYYDITFPAAADGQKIVIGGRANSGTVVSFMVSDITEMLAENRKIFIKETALSKSISTNTPTVYIPVKIESGKQYVFHYKWPTQQIVLGGSSPASSGLKIWTTNTPLDSAPQVQLLRQIHYQASSFQEEYLYFTAAGDADYLAFYCHLLSGTLSCALEIGYYPETLGVKFGGIENGYYGEKMAVHPVKNIAGENVVAVSGIGSYNSKSAQGMAIFGKYAFLTYDTGYIQILNLETFAIVASYAMPAGVQQANNHAGMANFAYSIQSGDDFPLLYVSSYLENCCYVLRVTLSGCTLVQTISMANAYHFFVDDAGQMIVHMSDNIYNIFDIPDPNGGDVTLNAATAKDSFTFDLADYNYTGTICQGGKMYVLVYYMTTPPGVSGRYDRLICYDYNRKAIVSEIVFQNSKIRTIEFEGLAVNEDGYFVLEFVADQLAFIKP